MCGDFGIWHDNAEERYWLKWLNNKPFTTVFVDGNHENFDRLYSDEFPIVDFHGGKAHKIRDNIYHLMRGYVFEFDGKRFFCLGGASSHDISDGILDRADFDWYYEVTGEDYKYNGRHIEGFVVEDANGYMVKLKLCYYTSGSLCVAFPTKQFVRVMRIDARRRL